MKLQCQIEVINRTHNILNVRTSSRYLKSTLVIGKEPNCEAKFFILHFSTVNKSGTKYQVRNIKQVFVKCLNDGKSTIRFEEPPHDLCIKSESIQLKCFMRLLKSCISGDAKALQLAPLASLGVTAKDNAPTKLVIHDRSEFPCMGLPRTLESLYMSGLKLFNFRREILLLKHLTILDLSNNEMEKIPPEFGRVPCLSELYLSNNQLGIKGEIDWQWLIAPQIIRTLKLLDLSGNKLGHLPKAIWKLQRLITLKLDNNELQSLPHTLGRISSLRYLTISRNNLESLPCSLLQCRLVHIDICANKFQNTEFKMAPTNSDPWQLYVGNLVSLASKVILKHKIYYAPNIIPRTLVDFLDNINICVCGAPAITELSFKKEFALKEFFRVVVFDDNRNSSVEFECFFCSDRCYKTLVGNRQCLINR